MPDKTPEGIIVQPTQAVTKDEQPQSVVTMLMSAVSNGTPVETIEKLMAMRREIRAEEAKEAYDRAMSDFQRDCPIVEKTKEAKQNGSTMYSYAPLDVIVSAIREHVAKNGFSYGFKAEVTEGRVKVICTVKHVMGHSESTDFDIPLSTKTGIMSAPQQVAATLTFAKRYALKNAFGIETGDDDNDAQDEKTSSAKATPEQHAQIDKLAGEAGYTKAEVVQKCKTQFGVAFSMITEQQASSIINGLHLTIKNKKV
jgi:hypothetical protein